MCYSLESSIISTGVSLSAILLLFFFVPSPKDRWMALSLTGWCGMQFAELILWWDQVRPTPLNVFVTTAIIPLVLMLQPLGPLYGSYYLRGWQSSSRGRCLFTVLLSVMVFVGVSYSLFNSPLRNHTMVTEDGHLFWAVSNLPTRSVAMHFYVWVGLITLTTLLTCPSRIDSICLVLSGCAVFYMSLLHVSADSRGSVWCYYTHYISYTSVALKMARLCMPLLLPLTGKKII
jgi:hypothetical protein